MAWLAPTVPGWIDRGSFPKEYFDRPPPVSWSDPGPHVESFVIALEDLQEVPPRVHWCVFDVPGTARTLEGDPAAAGAKVARNDFWQVGYAPPSHVKSPGWFALRLIALSERLDLPASVHARDVLARTEGKVTQLAVISGTYEPERSALAELPAHDAAVAAQRRKTGRHATAGT